jgi:hypothetical protein
MSNADTDSTDSGGSSISDDHDSVTHAGHFDGDIDVEAASSGSKHRCWCFTMNNYNDEDIAILKGIGGVSRADGGQSTNGPWSKYLVFSEEIAPATGTKHLQGYMQFASQVYFTSLNTRLRRRAWLAVAKASPEMNRLYVTKTRPVDLLPNEVVYEYGEIPKGRKTNQNKQMERYATARDLAISNRIQDIDPDLQVRFYQTWKRMRDDAWLNQDLTTIEGNDLPNEWLWGPAGTGKSRDARTRYPDAYLKNCNKWWDGYVGQTTVIIEDFDKRHDGLIHHLKIWGDRYPFTAEVKMSSISARPLKIIVTSNYSISQIWGMQADLGPMLRRFREIEFLPPIGTPEPVAIQSSYAMGFRPF